MKFRHKGSTRQRVWSVFRSGEWMSIQDLASDAGATEQTTRGYVNALIRIGYAARADDRVRLLKDTGEIAVSTNNENTAYRDWNLEPTLSASELHTIWKASGLSYMAFARALGFNQFTSNRLKEMTQGKRTVTDAVDKAARDFRKTLNQKSG